MKFSKSLLLLSSMMLLAACGSNPSPKSEPSTPETTSEESVVAKSFNLTASYKTTEGNSFDVKTVVSLGADTAMSDLSFTLADSDGFSITDGVVTATKRGVALVTVALKDSVLSSKLFTLTFAPETYMNTNYSGKTISGRDAQLEPVYDEGATFYLALSGTSFNLNIEAGKAKKGDDIVDIAAVNFSGTIGETEEGLLSFTSSQEGYAAMTGGFSFINDIFTLTLKYNAELPAVNLRRVA